MSLLSGVACLHCNAQRSIATDDSSHQAPSPDLAIYLGACLYTLEHLQSLLRWQVPQRTCSLNSTLGCIKADSEAACRLAHRSTVLQILLYL